MSDPKPHLTVRSVQVLRALAALAVVYYHCNSPQNGYGFAETGSWGVDIFFVISGFIIARMLTFGTTDFLRKRLCRVVPLYYLATAAMVAAVLLLGSRVNSTEVSWGGALKSALFIPYEMSTRGGPVLEVGWTLEYEMFFYLVVGVLLWIMRRSMLALLGTVVALSALALSGLLWPAHSYVVGFYQSGLFVEFLFGVALWYGYRAYAQRRHLFPRPASIAISFAAPTVIIVALAAMAAEDTVLGYQQDHARFLMYGLPALAIVAAALSIEHLLPEGRVTVGLLEIGDASYAMYLFHPFMILLISRVLFTHVLVGADMPVKLALLALALVITTVGSIAIHRIVDTPIQQTLRKALGVRRRRSSASVSAPLGDASQA